MGIVLAIFYKGEGPQREEYVWEEEDDDDGEGKGQGEGKKPYWDVPEPDRDELTVVYRFKKK